MATRIEVVTDCIHGRSVGFPHCPEHRECGFDGPVCEKWCPGGSRRVLDPGSYVLIEKQDGEWPEWAVQRAVNGLSIWTWVGKETPLYASLQPRAVEFLDALAGGES